MRAEAGQTLAGGRRGDSGRRGRTRTPCFLAQRVESAVTGCERPGRFCGVLRAKGILSPSFPLQDPRSSMATAGDALSPPPPPELRGDRATALATCAHRGPGHTPRRHDSTFQGDGEADVE